MSGTGSKKSSITSTIGPKLEELRFIDILATDETGNSALMIAIQDNKLETAKFIIDRAFGGNKLNEVLQIVNKNDENAYSLALRAENSGFLRLIEEATEKDKKMSLRRSRKFLKYKSSESFKSSPKNVNMNRPKSEEVIGSASTSDVEPEIDESFATDKEQQKSELFKEVLTHKLSALSDATEKEESDDKNEKNPPLMNLHSESFTFEHETIDFIPVQNTGIMNSLSDKFKSLIGGRKEDPQRQSKKSSVTTTQVHFTSMPVNQCEVYDGTQQRRYDIDNAISADPLRDRVTIAHHHFEESGDNSVCVPPEFSGPEASKKTLLPPGDKASGHTSAAQTLMKPLKNLRSRGSSREGRAGNYKALPDPSPSTSSVVQ